MYTLEDLVIDLEFQDTIPSLSPLEYEQLEANILSEGRLLQPLIVWDGVILDGHNRYRILHDHPEISYMIYEKDFANRWEAMEWICRNQLGRRNISPNQRKYLMGKQYGSSKHANGGDRRSDEVRSDIQNEYLKNNQRTCDRIAEENNTSASFVQRAEKFADGIDAIQEVCPAPAKEILSGVRKVPSKAIEEIGKANEHDRLPLILQLDEKPEPQEPIQPATTQAESIRQIEDISKGMEKSKGTVIATVDDMIYEMADALENLEWRWNNTKEAYSGPLATKSGKKRIMKLAEDGINYLTRIKEGELWK